MASYLARSKPGSAGCPRGDERRTGGSVQLVGRAREQIVLGSGRLAPDVVEAILRRHVPADLDFVVAGVASTGRSDAIAVFLAGRETDEPTRQALEGDLV